MHARAVERCSSRTTATRRPVISCSYQPVVCWPSPRGQLRALVRWKHPEKNLVMPEPLRQPGQETGLVIAARHLGATGSLPPDSDWARLTPAGPLVSVNLSRRWRSRGFVELKELVSATGLRAGALAWNLEARWSRGRHPWRTHGLARTRRATDARRFRHRILVAQLPAAFDRCRRVLRAGGRD